MPRVIGAPEPTPRGSFKHTCNRSQSRVCLTGCHTFAVSDATSITRQLASWSSPVSRCPLSIRSRRSTGQLNMLRTVLWSAGAVRRGGVSPSGTAVPSNGTFSARASALSFPRRCAGVSRDVSAGHLLEDSGDEVEQHVPMTACLLPTAAICVCVCVWWARVVCRVGDL